MAADSCGGYAYFRPAPGHPYVINEVLEMEGMWAIVKEGDSSYTFHPRPEYTDGQRQEVLGQVQMRLNHIADVNGYERVQVRASKSYGNGIVPVPPKPSSPEVLSEPVVSRFCPARHLPKHRIT
ncbi:hypothetical protein HY546_00025 [archaeon]|nr:hypothetical protein [archaeon]